MRQSSEQVYGPYYEQERNRWKVIVKHADGTRSVATFAEESEAHKVASDARSANDQRTVKIAVDAYLESIPDKGRDTARFRLYALLKLPGRDCLLRQLNERTAAKLYAERSASVKAGTHHGELQVARRMFGGCIERGWIG